MTHHGLPRSARQTPPHLLVVGGQGLATATIDAARGLRAVVPTAAVILEPAAFACSALSPPGDCHDLLVWGLLAQGWTLLADDPQTVELPLLSGWRLMTEQHELTLCGPYGDRLLDRVAVPPLPGWDDAVREQGRCALIAGTRIGLWSGQPGLIAAIRAGRVVGAITATRPVADHQTVDHS
jgi:hypothetical protein